MNIFYNILFSPLILKVWRMPDATLRRKDGRKIEIQATISELTEESIGKKTRGETCKRRGRDMEETWKRLNGDIRDLRDLV